MGRSVSYAGGSVAVCYRELEEDENYDDFYFQEFLDDVLFKATKRWPSLYPCEEWLGNEDKALLENSHCYIGISTYCGLASIWLVPKEYPKTDSDALALAWCESISENFHKTFGEFQKIGTASNGESFFQKIEKGE